MSAIDDGGPAFPNNDQHGCAFSGMTLRDWFAGQALTSVIKSSGDLSCYYDNMAGSKGDNDIPSPYALASFSYEIADAMLAARKGGAA